MQKKFQCILNAANPGSIFPAWLQQNPSPPPFMDCAGKIPAGPRPYHSGSVLEHMCRCMNEVAGNPLAVWMALAHDAGKLTTPSVLLPHHYGHEQRGAILAEIWARKLGLGEDYAQAGRLAARWHMRAGRYPALRPGKKHSLLMAVFSTSFADAFWAVVDADTSSKISLLARKDWMIILAAKSEKKDMQEQLRLLYTASA